MASRRLIPKRVRIAIYAAFCFVVWSLCTFLLLVMFQGAADRRIDELQRRFDERLRDVSSSSMVSTSVDVPTSSSERMSEDDIPRYIVLGHGRSKRFGYIDIQYVCDGEVDRFFYRPETIVRVVDDIDRELFRHENGLISDRSSDRLSSDNSFNY